MEYKDGAEVVADFLELIRSNPDVLIPEGLEYKYDPKYAVRTVRYDVSENGTGKSTQAGSAAAIHVTCYDDEKDPFVWITYLGGYNKGYDEYIYEPKVIWNTNYEEEYHLNEIWQEGSSQDPLELLIIAVIEGINEFLSGEGFI